MLIKELDQNSILEWRIFIKSIESSRIYYTPEYKNFLSKFILGDSRYFGVWDSGNLKGILPLFISYSNQNCKVVNSLPWYGSHGGCLISPDANKTARVLLIKKYKELIEQETTLSSTLILDLDEQKYLQSYKDLLNQVIEDERIGQVTNLPGFSENTEIELEQMIHQKTRNLVRKSLKQGFEIVNTNEDWAWDFLYETHKENLIRIGGNPKPKDHFIAIRESFPDSMKTVSIATLDKVPVAGLLLLYFNKTIEYFTPVIKHDYRSSQPLSFLIWMNMIDGIRNNYSWWNWGGTWKSQKSLHHFKSRWGAKDYPYSYLISVAEKNMGTIKLHRNNFSSLFPFFYVYPIDRI